MKKSGGPEYRLVKRMLREGRGGPVKMPTTLAKLALDQLWKLRLSSYPSQGLDHLR